MSEHEGWGGCSGFSHSCQLEVAVPVPLNTSTQIPREHSSGARRLVDRSGNHFTSKQFS
jgi:hypothetical protein